MIFASVAGSGFSFSLLILEIDGYLFDTLPKDRCSVVLCMTFDLTIELTGPTGMGTELVYLMMVSALS